MNEQQYNEIPALRASFLKACSMGPYQGWKSLHMGEYSNEAMDFGTAVHMALLEPARFAESYCLVPMDAPKPNSKPLEDYKKVTDKHIATAKWWADFEARTKGKTVLDPKDAARLERIKARCQEVPAVRQALETFEKEKAYVWGESPKFKARLDLVDEANGVIIDIKTTRDASQRAFTQQALQNRYDIQFLHYARALQKPVSFYVIAIESDTGEVALYNFDEIIYSKFTQQRYEMALAIAQEVLQMKQCPPKYTAEIVKLNLPEWALKETV